MHHAIESRQNTARPLPFVGRQRELAAAKGNPGQILAICRMAARPEYQRGRYIKFLPLRMDMLSAFLS